MTKPSSQSVWRRMASAECKVTRARAEKRLANLNELLTSKGLPLAKTTKRLRRMGP